MIFIWLEQFAHWLDENNWVYLVIVAFLFIMYILIDILNRKRELRNFVNNLYSNSSEDYEQSMLSFYASRRRTDIKLIFLYPLMSCLPFLFYMIAWGYLDIGIELPSIISIISFIMLIVFVFITARIRGDKTLRVLWLIPTFTLFSAVSLYLNETSGTYSGTISESGRVTISRDGGGFMGLLAIFVGIPLFFLKLGIILLIITMSAFTNVLLSILYSLVIYPIYLIVTKRKMKEIVQHMYS